MIDSDPLKRVHRPITIEQLHDTVADLPDEVVICALRFPDGVNATLIYRGFVLSRLIMDEEEVSDISDLMFSHIPQFITSEYLQATTNGDFDLAGQLWMPRSSVVEIHKELDIEHYPLSKLKSTNELIIDGLESSQSVITKHLQFTPYKSQTLLENRFFATYEDFFTVLGLDFPHTHFMLTTVRSIDNIVPFCLTDCVYETGMVLLFRNDRIKNKTPMELDPISIVKISPVSSIQAKIESVTISPNRFGLLKPVVTARIENPLQEDVLQFTLPTIKDVLIKPYREGDVVTVEYTSNIPRLGETVIGVNRDIGDPVDEDLKRIQQRLCPYCGSSLALRSGGLYCNNPECSMVILNRIQYACQPGVLDLPFTVNDLQFILYPSLEGSQSSVSLVTILTFGRTDLEEFADDSKIDDILEILRTRHAQLHGLGYDRRIQTLTQGRFLDALSLQGLMRSHIRRLQKGLSEDILRWSDLSNILTDHMSLIASGIPSCDVRDIIEAAKLRRYEIDALSKF